MEVSEEVIERKKLVRDGKDNNNNVVLMMVNVYNTHQPQEWPLWTIWLRMDL